MYVSTKPTFSIRPTKTSLARQSLSSKMRCSIVPAQPVNSRRSLSQVSNTYSELNTNNDQVQNNVFKRQEQQYRKTTGVTKNVIFKRRSVKKLAVILSESSMNNSTEAETLKQVIVSSLTENVKKLEIVVKDQENKPPIEEKYKKKQSLFTSSSARSTTLPRLLCAGASDPQSRRISSPILRPVPLPMNKQLEILAIEPPSDSKEKDELDEDEQVVYGEIYVMNYIRDIMNLLYALELYYPISNAYLRTSTESKTWKITFKHRTTLVEWLIQSFYCRFRLSQDSLHVCIQLLDRFLQHCSLLPSTSQQTDLQLIGVATLLLATKLEETQHPAIDDLIFLTDNAYKPTDLKQMERKILQDLQFELNRPTSLQFLRRYSFLSSAADEQHSIGKYLIDLALLDFNCISLKSSLIAASATYISRFILTYVTDEVFDYYWPEELQTMTPYKTYEDLSSGIKALTNILVKISSLSRSSLNEFNLLFKKYGHEHLSCASTFCLQKQKLIQKLANGYYL
ncbi:unnamed protein product [Didymodactylos carnosus]|uniref:Cyclin N-terminal domain-containing protein n=1 Tax=Didymodactylos carnosus TaxID=1234261 RepID=A0A8S2HAZ4_9BILA|nr:unnamed protein product [Didymodactylos carnosus]CAF3617604.1 unnamed protein product [Didymodactylos carnosus]